jgi:hypothetical protein
MDVLKEIFPQIPTTFLEIALDDAYGDLTVAINSLELDEYSAYDEFAPPALPVRNDGKPEGSAGSAGSARVKKSELNGYLDSATEVLCP